MMGPVLIIDASLTVRMDLGDTFREAGFDVTLCASAAEAWRAVEADEPALVVLDVLLPDADGVEVLGEMRRRVSASLPVLLLSSEAQIKDRIRGLAQGANEYIGKPYEASHVVARARELLRSRKESATEEPVSVLIVDDSLTYREELSEKLRGAGFVTYLARSGEEGLQMAAGLRPDAMIIDGVMPGMEGTSVVRRIRLDPGLHATPCLLLTASEGAASEVVALDSGADAYVRKGEGTDVILARLGAMLRTAQQPRERTHAASLMGPKRILAVDDSRTYLEEVAQCLRGDGYDVVKASSGEEALELLGVAEVDCILLDLLMPGLSGTETCKRIKSSPVVRNIPVIMLTAQEQPQAVIEGMNAGADDYVVKSVDFEVIKARLRAQLRRKQFEDESRRVRESMLKKDAEAQAAREQAEARAVLLRELEAKNRELSLLNDELQVFAYSVSHDLRQPLRSMDGFSQVLLQEYGERLDDQGRHYLQRVRAGAQRMDQLIDGLLMLSRVTSKDLHLATVQVHALATRVMDRLRDAEPDRYVEVIIEEPIVTTGDLRLVESVLENLLGNAWKFTAKTPRARIEVGVERSEGGCVYFVRDNGVGFEMRYADKLFAPFRRLHSETEFAGTGVGLATVQRIVHRHGGRIWATSQPGEGATFRFTLSPDAKGYRE